MAKRIAVILVVMILLGVLGTGCSVYKENSAEGKKITAKMADLEAEINRENWEQAEDTLGEISEAWENSRWLIVFNAAVSELREMEDQLSRLTIWIREQQKQDALIELANLKNTWTRLGDQ